MNAQWTVASALMVLPGLLAAGLLRIQYKNFETRTWRKTSGKIVEARSEARDIRKVVHKSYGGDVRTHFVDQETIETQNFAVVRYEFNVDGLVRNAERIHQGADKGNFDVAETLRKYPEGKIVDVFYDPDAPDRSILERADGAMIRSGWVGVVVLIVLIFGGVFGIERFAAFTNFVIPRPQYTPLVVAFAGFALVLAGFARMISKKGAEMANWPRAPGEVIRSEVAETTRWDDNVVTTIYVPRIVYRFVVAGQGFEGDNVGAVLSGASSASALKRIAKMPVGLKVDVYYNAQDPTESALNASLGYAPAVLWALAAVSAFVSAAVAGLAPGL